MSAEQTPQKPEVAQRRRWWQRKPKPVYVCEVCKSSGVERRGIWDYCRRGHIYVGARAYLGEAS